MFSAGIDSVTKYALVIFQEVAAERKLNFEESILTQLASGFAGDRPSALIIHGGPGTLGKVRLFFFCTSINIRWIKCFTQTTVTRLCTEMHKRILARRKISIDKPSIGVAPTHIAARKCENGQTLMAALIRCRPFDIVELATSTSAAWGQVIIRGDQTSNREAELVSVLLEELERLWNNVLLPRGVSSSPLAEKLPCFMTLEELFQISLPLVLILDYVLKKLLNPDKKLGSVQFVACGDGGQIINDSNMMTPSVADAVLFPMQMNPNGDAFSVVSHSRFIELFFDCSNGTSTMPFFPEPHFFVVGIQLDTHYRSQGCAVSASVCQHISVGVINSDVITSIASRIRGSSSTTVTN